MSQLQILSEVSTFLLEAKMKYSLKKKVWCMNQMKVGVTPVSEISRNRHIPRKTLYRWYKKFKEQGTDGLINKPKGVKPLIINSKFEDIILVYWKQFNPSLTVK